MYSFSTRDHTAKAEKLTFVEDEQLASADDRAGQRQDLSLADRKVTAAGRDLAF
jgi:hypothetical protein